MLSATKGFGVYHLVKARIDLGRNGESGKFLVYCVLDPGSVRLFHGRLSKGDSLPRGIKTFWRDFCSYIDAEPVQLPVKSAPKEHSGTAAQAPPPEAADLDAPKDEVPAPEIPDDGDQTCNGEAPPAEEEPLSMEVSLLQSLRQTLEDSGIYDIREENISKTRRLEEAFAKVGMSFDPEGCVAFLKVEGLSTLEAEELLSCYPDESAKEDFWVPRRGDSGRSREVREIPKAVFPCHASVSPVSGIPASELLPGDMVTVNVPMDSLLYSILKFQRGGSFSGDLDIPLETVKPGEGDRVILEFSLSDDISAVAVVQGSLRVRAVRGQGTGCGKQWWMSQTIQQALIFGSIGLAALMILFILFSR